MSVVKKLETIQRRFLWDDSNSIRRYHLVACNEIKKLLYLGGLKLRSLGEMNVALQGKWLWRFMKEECVLWRILITTKFGIDKRGGLLEEGQDRMRKDYGKKQSGPR